MGKKKERDAIVFLNEQLKMAGEVLSDSEMGRLINMLRAYSLEYREANLSFESSLFKSIYEMMRAAQDKSIAKYEETCERNKRSAQVRSQREQQALAYASSCSRGSQSNLIKSNLV